MAARGWRCRSALPSRSHSRRSAGGRWQSCAPRICSRLWQDASPRAQRSCGFLFTAGTFLAGTYWLYHSIHEIGHAPSWIAIFLMFGMVAIMGGYCACSATSSRVGCPRGHDALRWLVVPAASTVLEWFRGWFLSGFPWLALGYTQTDTPLAGFAPLGGVYRMSLLVALSAGAVVLLIRERVRVSPRPSRSLRSGFAASSLATGMDAADGPAGHGRDRAGRRAAGCEVECRVSRRDLELYRDLTAPHLGTDIIVWPESALPDLPEQLRDYLSLMRSATRENGSTLITGSLHFGENDADVRNGVLVLDDEPQWYDKRRLVPFGEFFPVPSFMRDWMRLRSLPYSDSHRARGISRRSMRRVRSSARRSVTKMRTRRTSSTFSRRRRCSST